VGSFFIPIFPSETNRKKPADKGVKFTSVIVGYWLLINSWFGSII